MAYLALLALGALDAAGYSVIAPVAPAIGARTGAGPGLVGALVACFGLGQFAGYPLAGRVVQRRHASAVLAAALALMALGDLGFVIGGSLPVFFPARFLQGVGAGGLWIGVTFGILERFPGEEYRRLTGLLGAYSVGAIAGPGLGAVGGIRGPFLLHLGLVAAGGVVVARLGAPRERPAFGSDRAALRTPGFRLASAGILLVSLAFGTLDGPLPLHFAERLSQAEIGALYVCASLVVGAAAAVGGKLEPRRILAAGTVAIVAGVALAGAASSILLWAVALGLAAVGLGVGEAGALGVLLAETGPARIVLAMVLWSQVWAIGYLAGPAVAGGVVEALGFSAVGLVPVAAALVVVGTLGLGRRWLV